TAISTKSAAATVSPRSVLARIPGSRGIPGKKTELPRPLLIASTTSGSRAHSLAVRPARRTTQAMAVPKAPPPMIAAVFMFARLQSPRSDVLSISRPSAGNIEDAPGGKRAFRRRTERHHRRNFLDKNEASPRHFGQHRADEFLAEVLQQVGLA